MLLLPFDASALNRSWLLVGGDDPETALLARFSSPPSFLDNSGSWIDESSLGLKIIGSDGARIVSSALPFEGQVKLIAALHGMFEENGADTESQLELASAFFPGSELLSRIEAELRADEPKVLPATNVKVCLALKKAKKLAKGKAQRCKTIKTIAAGKTARVKFNVKTRKIASKKKRLAFTISAGYVSKDGATKISRSGGVTLTK